MFARSTDKYQVLARFQAAHGPTTSLAMSHDGSFLASGGDNESVQIWDVQEGKVFGTLSDRLGRWGQITCMKWLEGVMQVKSYIVCFGTGRGYMIFYEKVQDTNTFRELTCRAIFPFNDPVEAIDYDGNKERLVASSHAGRIALYSVAKQGTFLEMIWKKGLPESVNGKETIPRAVQFVGNGESVIVCGLESGTIFSKASSTGSDVWQQQIKSSIGDARLSPNGNMILVDNLVDGFDVYSFPALEHIDFLEIPRAEPYFHGGAFVEGSNGVACGSDHGQIYLFSTKTGKSVEKLRIGSKKSTIQAIDGFSDERHHLIAAATSDETPEIVIWRKLHIKTTRNRTATSSPSLKVIFLFNVIVLVAVLAIFFPSRLRRESTLDIMANLHRQPGEVTIEGVKAWELAKAEAEADAEAEAWAKAQVEAWAKAKAKAGVKVKARGAQDTDEAHIRSVRRQTAHKNGEMGANRRNAGAIHIEKDYGADLTKKQATEVIVTRNVNAQQMDDSSRNGFAEVSVQNPSNNVEQGGPGTHRNNAIASEKGEMGTDCGGEVNRRGDGASVRSGDYLDWEDSDDGQED